MKGSPGGILLVAVGILFLNLGFTGRFSAVWKALSTGTPSGDESGDGSTIVPDPINPDNGSGSSGRGKSQNQTAIANAKLAATFCQSPKIGGDINGHRYCIDLAYEAGMGSDGKCPRNTDYVTLSDGTYTCVGTAAESEPVTGGGEGPNRVTVMMPNGSWQVRNITNVRGIFPNG